jgi:hypothetical protein
MRRTARPPGRPNRCQGLLEWPRPLLLLKRLAGRHPCRPPGRAGARQERHAGEEQRHGRRPARDGDRLVQPGLGQREPIDRGGGGLCRRRRRRPGSCGACEGGGECVGGLWSGGWNRGQPIEVAVSMQDLELVDSRAGFNEQIRRRHRESFSAGFLGEPRCFQPYGGVRGNGFDSLFQLAKPFPLPIIPDAIPELEPNDVAEACAPVCERCVDGIPHCFVPLAAHCFHPGRGIDEQWQGHVTRSREAGEALPGT